MLIDSLKFSREQQTTRGTLPVNVIVVAEGEEEVGSVNLENFIAMNAGHLACDAVVISDSTMFAPGVPSILSSLRGLAYFEVTVRGPASDLHSGMYGGAVANPAMALARALATLHDARGRIAIKGFYDRVKPFPAAVLKGMRKLPHSDAKFRKEVGVRALGGEAGKTTLEKLWTRPTSVGKFRAVRKVAALQRLHGGEPSQRSISSCSSFRRNPSSVFRVWSHSPLFL